MTVEDLYERYKDALRRGHVAALGGQLDEALSAYAEAARIAPERAAPHTAAGSALLRARRPGEAMPHFAAALLAAPHDEAALLGRAQALGSLGRRAEAASVYDLLAEVRAAGGRLADALDAARHGLELAEGRERRRTLELLIAQLRAQEPGGDEPGGSGRAALARALQVLEGLALPTTPVGDAASPAIAGTTSVPSEARAGADLAEAAARAESAVAADDPDVAVGALLDLADAYARAGCLEAALDACYEGLAFDPDGVAVHLQLVELYAARGWATLAAEKLDLLERLARLEGDDDAAVRVAGTRARRS